MYYQYYEQIPRNQENKLLMLMIDVVKNEAYSELMFDYLKVISRTETDKKLLNKMLTEEREHCGSLKQFYVLLSGKEAVADAPKFEIPESYSEGLKEIFIKKISKIAIYKEMYNESWSLPALRDATIIFQSDELKHLAILNFLQLSK